MLRGLVVVAGGALLVGIALSPNLQQSRPTLNETTTVASTSLRVGDGRALFRLEETVLDGHVQGYVASVEQDGERLGQLRVSRSEGEHLHAWLREHHVFASAGQLLRQLTATLLRS